MDTRNLPSDRGNPDDLESRMARLSFVAPPPDLRAACLSRAGRNPAVVPGLPLWRRVWIEFLAPHPIASVSLAAAWMTIFGLWLATPEVGRSEPGRYARIPEENRRALAAQRAELMASLLGREPGSDRDAESPKHRRVPNSTTQPPRTSLSQTNRMA
jgi:anti-sigma factor RsiW